MISRHLEIYGPSELSLSLAGVWICIPDLPQVPETLTLGTLTFGVVVAGFTATQRNMLIGMRALKVLADAAKVGYDHDILRYLRQCVWASMVLVVVSVARFFLNDCPFPSAQMQVWTFFWVGSFILVITTMIRNEYMMYLIVGRVMKGSRPPELSSKR